MRHPCGIHVTSWLASPAPTSGHSSIPSPLGLTEKRQARAAPAMHLGQGGWTNASATHLLPLPLLQHAQQSYCLRNCSVGWKMNHAVHEIAPKFNIRIRTTVRVRIRIRAGIEDQTLKSGSRLGIGIGLGLDRVSGETSTAAGFKPRQDLPRCNQSEYLPLCH